MWKHRLLASGIGLALCASVVWAQRQVLPPGPMQEKARLYCLPCHDARIIVQQPLDRNAWTRVIDKMVRWGTPVPPEEREPLIEYFAANFGPPKESSEKPELAAGPGVEKVRAACLSCHNVGVIIGQRLDRRDWQGAIDRMTRWGAEIKAADRAEILNYLAREYAARPPAKGAR